MVRSLVLLAPAGIIRPSHFSWVSRFLFSSYVPDWIIEWLVEKRLRCSPVHSRASKTGYEKDLTVKGEVEGNRDPDYEMTTLLEGRTDLTIATSVKWQLDYHRGFVASFVNSVRNSSIEGREERWWKLAEREGKFLVIGRRTDLMNAAEELRVDVLRLLGEEKVDWRVVDGGGGMSFRLRIRRKLLER